MYIYLNKTETLSAIKVNTLNLALPWNVCWQLELSAHQGYEYTVSWHFVFHISIVCLYICVCANLI